LSDLAILLVSDTLPTLLGLLTGLTEVTSAGFWEFVEGLDLPLPCEDEGCEGLIRLEALVCLGPPE
jgi:hypothetical protein